MINSQNPLSDNNNFTFVQCVRCDNDPSYLYYRCRRRQSRRRPPLWATQIKTRASSRSCWRPCSQWMCSICTNRRLFIPSIRSITITIIVTITITIIIISNSSSTFRAAIRTMCSSGTPRRRMTRMVGWHLSPRQPPVWSTTTARRRSCTPTTRRSFTRTSTRCRWSSIRRPDRRRRRRRRRRPASPRDPPSRPPPPRPLFSYTIRSCNCNTRIICRRRYGTP